MMARRVLIYSHDTYGLGNVRRNHALAHRLCAANPETRVLLLTSSRWYHLLPAHPRIDYVKLPEIVRVAPGTYRSRSEGVSIAPLLRAREEIIRGTVRGFRPRVFLTDKIPTSTRGELTRALELMEHRSTVLVLLLRDVLDEPEWVRAHWAETGQYEALERYYREAWIFGDADVFPTASAYGLDRVPGLTVRSLGYISRSGRAGSSPPPPEESSGRVLVTVGGGEDGAALLDAVARVAWGRPSPALDVVLGPYLPTEDRQRLVERLGSMDGVRLEDFAPDLPARIQSAAGVVSMGGYNTVCEILGATTPALVMPRSHPAREQTLRAEAMSERSFFHSTPLDEIGGESDAVLARFLDEPHQDGFPRPRMTGLDLAADAMEALRR